MSLDDSRRAVRTERPNTVGGLLARGGLGRFAICFRPGADRPRHQDRPTDFADQVRQALNNVGAIAEAAGARLADAVRVGVFLANLDDFSMMDTVYREYFHDPMPARTTVGAAIRGYDIEIDAVIALRAGM